MVDELRALPRVEGTPPPSREELLATIETVAAGPAKRKITRAQEADSARRAEAVKAMQPRFALAWTTVAILLTVPGIVLYLPDPLLDTFFRPVETLTGEATTYYYSIRDVGFLAGVMTAVGAIIHWALELHRPRSLPYHAMIYLPYLLFGIPAASGAVGQWVNHGPYGPLVLIGICLQVGAVLSFVCLLVFARRSPSAKIAVWHGTEQARELDEKFRAEVRRAIHENEHVHLDSYRAQALDGIRLLYQHRLTDADDALWMLREIAPGPAAAAE